MGPASSSQRRYARALPPAATEPLVLADRMHELGGAVWLPAAETMLAGRQIFHMAQSKTLVDVGSWTGRARIWVFATDEGLSLGAWGGLSATRDPFESHVTYGDIDTYLYNDVTAELLVQQHRQYLQTPPLKMHPLDGYQFLAQIEKGIVTHD